jgi:hypothetical protein
MLHTAEIVAGITVSKAGLFSITEPRERAAIT